MGNSGKEYCLGNIVEAFLAEILYSIISGPVMAIFHE